MTACARLAAAALLHIRLLLSASLDPCTGFCAPPPPSAGAYLIDNGRTLILWLGQALAPQFYAQAFGVQAPPQDTAGEGGGESAAGAACMGVARPAAATSLPTDLRRCCVAPQA